MCDIRSEIRRHPNQHYVYGLYKPDGTVFYIGVGVRDRVLQHGRPHDIRNHGKSLRVKTILKIRNSGQEIVRKILKFFPDRLDALRYEQSLVTYFGKRVNKTGLLTNLTDGGDGCIGHKPSEETLHKMVERGRRADLTKLHLAAAEARKIPILCLNNMEVFEDSETLYLWLRSIGIDMHRDKIAMSCRQAVVISGLMFEKLNKGMMATVTKDNYSEIVRPVLISKPSCAVLTACGKYFSSLEVFQEHLVDTGFKYEAFLPSKILYNISNGYAVGGYQIVKTMPTCSAYEYLKNEVTHV